MSTTEVAVVNIALIEIGEAPIDSLTEATNQARIANRVFETTRDRVMAIHPWNCLQKRANLAQLLDDPIFGYDHAYQLPDDFLRLTRLSDIDYDYRIERRMLLTDRDDVNIVYVARITDPSQWDDQFAEALSARLAATLALKLTGSRELQAQMMRVYELRLAEARYQDSQQAPVETISGNTWLNARHTGVSDEPYRAIESV